MTSTASRKTGLHLIFATAVIALHISSTLALASPESLDEIRSAIKARGARWHADETSVSKLSHQEKKMRLGLSDEGLSSSTAPSEGAPIPEVTTAPATLDWRNSNGVSYVSPIKNQGSCGSCWAFATTAGLESQVMIGTSGAPADLSEQILVSCSGAGSCSGGYTSTASTYLVNVGLPPESDYRYTATDGSCSSAISGWQTETKKINGWHRPTVTTTFVDAMKSALYSYGPVIASMYVYDDFYSYRSGVYSYTSGSYLGAHAVLVVGYDDVQQCFIVKNSWGTGWGEAGFFQIAYSEVTGTSKFGYSVQVYDGYNGAPVVPDTTAPVVSVSSPSIGSTLSGTMAVAIAASDNAGVTSVRLYLDGALLGTDTTAPYSFTWNTLTTANGAHSLQAVAYDAAGNSGTSSPVAVTVNNIADTTPPTVTITSPSNGATVRKTVKVAVKAVDTIRLQRVDAYVDDKRLGSATCSASSCSASFNWNTNSGVAKGAHTLTVYAYDTSSNLGSASVTVYK